MTVLKIAYVLSLALLLVLLLFVAFKPMATANKYSEVQREQLLETREEWIVQFDIINREGKDMEYRIKVLVNGQPYTDRVLIKDSGKYIYIHHIYKAIVKGGEATFIVYKGGETNPMTQTTYYLKELGR